MKLTKVNTHDQLDNTLLVCVDVSKNKLNVFCPGKTMDLEDEIGNRTNVICKKLKEYEVFAKEQGFQGLSILVEPTNTYHQKILRIAHQMNHHTGIVNTESVSKMKVVESNDSGKTDIKDPRIIALLGKMRKVLKHRILDQEYQSLRELNQIYDDETKAMIITKNHVSNMLAKLFCDYPMGKDFIYSNSGRALIKLYKANPNRIVRSGNKLFSKRMRQAVPRIRKSTIEKLWSAANQSVYHQTGQELQSIQEDQLDRLMGRIHEQESTRSMVEDKVVELYRRLRLKDPSIPKAESGVITEFWMGSLLGEIGPINDFSSFKKLLRYVGLNLRERQSGTYRGTTRISKKGRVLARLILSRIIFPLIKKENLFGKYYHGKKDNGMPGKKAMVAVERKFLKMFYGWYRSGKSFDKHRVFTCTSQYYKVA